MRHLAWTAMAVAAVLATTGSLWAADAGTVRGTVSAVVPSDTPDGRTMLTVVLKGEGIWQAMLTVGPENKDAYATVLGLKAGDRVTVGWRVEGGRTLIREIVRGDGQPRAEGERKVEGDQPQGNKVEGGADREAKERALRQAREREAKAKAAALENQRAEEAKKNADREAGERAKRAAAEAEANARGGGEGKNRMRTVATVVSVETNEDDARVLNLKAVETGEESSFSVGADREALYAAVGKLKAGDKVTVAWKTEGGKPMLLEVGRSGGERKEREGARLEPR